MLLVPGWACGGSRGTGPFSATTFWGQVWATVRFSGPASPPQACTWLARKTGGQQSRQHWATRGVGAARHPEGLSGSP